MEYEVSCTKCSWRTIEKAAIQPLGKICPQCGSGCVVRPTTVQFHGRDKKKEDLNK